RVYLLNDRHELFDLRIHGQDIFQGPDAPEGGFLIFGAHLGSFEVLRAIARRDSRQRVCAAMYPENARLLNSMLAQVNAQVVLDIIPLGRIDSIFQLNERIEAGAMVALLADRAVQLLRLLEGRCPCVPLKLPCDARCCLRCCSPPCRPRTPPTGSWPT
ncbi:MAG: hypothetical protein K2X75_11615, partial [Burkholderiaceae bacterium]|nr:hypothetical protein [Burkholderiaceae bacterium]